MNPTVMKELDALDKWIVDYLDWFKKNTNLTSYQLLNMQIMFSNCMFILRRFIEENGD